MKEGKTVKTKIILQIKIAFTYRGLDEEFEMLMAKQIWKAIKNVNVEVKQPTQKYYLVYEELPLMTRIHQPPFKRLNLQLI